MLNRSAGPGIRPAPVEIEDPSIHYPESDGEPVAESDHQFYPLTDTVRMLKLYLADRPDVYVAGNMLVYYRVNDVTARLAPDVFVVFGVPNRLRPSYFVWREGKAPDFVIEIASASTVNNDLGDKRDKYAELGVAEYWRFDPTGECLEPRLQCDVLGADGQYRAAALVQDADGTVRGHSPLLGLDFHAPADDGRLRLYDPVKEMWLRNLPESEAALAETQARLSTTELDLYVEQQARLAIEARHESERQARRDAEARRESERQARRDAEMERDAAQERIRQLEAQLRRQQNS